MKNYFSEVSYGQVDIITVNMPSKLGWAQAGHSYDYYCPGDREFVRTFLERDMPQLGITVGAATLRRFWAMLAHRQGQVWNASEFGRSFGVADTTVRRYLDLLSPALVVRQLLTWHENLGKRQVKAPKVYVRDSGLLHALLGIGTRRELEHHPKVGASWEGYAVEETLKALRPDDAYYWATHGGAEIDLVLFKRGRRIGVECKRMDAPVLTPSMRIAFDDIRLDELRVVYPGIRRLLVEHPELIEPLILVFLLSDVSSNRFFIHSGR